ncbi:TPA: energy-coupling factor transporter transmembrane protein EcfT [Klebsiella pneumoniae]|nr:energy-coupling factor transporter transmembrane protein EcfT [Klebsiella pneumoniae]
MSGSMLYKPGDSFLHRADPRSKFIALLAILILALSTTRTEILLLTFFDTVIALRLLAKTPFSAYMRVVLFILPLIIILVVLQGIVQPGAPLITLGGVTLSAQGVQLGLALGLRLLTMGVCFLGFSATTRPGEVALAVHSAGVPYRYAYLTSFAFRFLPLMQEEAGVLLKAMSVRACADVSSRNPLRRGSAIVRMIVPILIGAMRRSADIALSMELRGYGLGTRRTFVRTLRLRGSDVALMLMAIIFVAAMLWIQHQGVTLFPLTGAVRHG